MSVVADIAARAAADPKHIVLVEGEDERVVAAAIRATRDNIAEITLLGSSGQIRPLLAAANGSDHNIRTIDPAHSPDIDRYAELFASLPRQKGKDKDAAIKAAREPLNFANLMVRSGDADGSIGGAAHKSGEVVQSAAKIIGRDPDCALISSFFLMAMEEDYHPRQGAVFFADCALIANPNAHKLAHIAAATTDSAVALLDIDSKLALLSFSTRGSAQHPSVDKMMEAGAKLKELRPDLPFESAIQFDAAFVPEVAASKAPDSAVTGEANIFIFPDLNAGNIGYKIAERIGGVRAIGPILQGLNRPANDLSRGCSSDDIYAMIAVTVVQGQLADRRKG